MGSRHSVAPTTWRTGGAAAPFYGMGAQPRRPWTRVDGLGMLVEQAAESLLFSGVENTRDTQTVVSSLRAASGGWLTIAVAR